MTRALVTEAARRAGRMILGVRLGPDGLGAGQLDRAGVDFVLLGRADGESAIGEDALSVAAFLITTTRRIGLVATMSCAWAPFNVARALAAMDHLSAGRCGWLLAPDAAAPSPAYRAEHLDVVLKLFDSWEDDALVFDKARSVFADRAKVHRIRHAGAYFTVDGPLNAPRPPQGRPVLFQAAAGASDEADVLLIDAGERDRADPRPRLAPITLDLGAEDAEMFCDRLADAFVAGHCDGFLLAPRNPKTDIPILAEHIMPRLCERGMAIGDGEPGDFRTRLGLPRPANRYASLVSARP